MASRSRSSQTLLTASGAGDRAALEELLVRHVPRVRAFVRLNLDPLVRAHESASDLVQSACREILAHPDRFEFQNEAAFVNWFCGAALFKTRERIKYYRAQQRDARRQLAPDAAADALATCYAKVSSPSQAAVGREFIARIESLLDELDETPRQVVIRACLLEEAHDEIARGLGISVDNSRQMLARARAFLARRLAQDESR